MCLKNLILGYFKYRNLMGYPPIKRKELLSTLKYIIPEFNDLTDREMRKAYEGLPVCGGNDGLFLPRTEGEINDQIELHKKKIKAYARKIKALKQYKIPSDPIQKELF